MERLFIFFQFITPHHLLSRCTAFLADLKSPKWLINLAISGFIRIFGVEMDEAEQSDYRRYASFNDFFTRALRNATRPLASADVLCPVDGVISQIGDIRHGSLLQAKGHRFSTLDLLGGDVRRARDFEGGSFATIYLSPRDYHRVHMPLAGSLTATTYIPGQLFSVNSVTAERVEGLFARNERLVCYFETQAGPLAMVLVGAMIVAGIETVWSGRVAPPPRKPFSLDYRNLPEPVALDKGAEMGRFCLGSTVILLFPAKSVVWRQDWDAGSATRMGSRLADFVQ